MKDIYYNRSKPNVDFVHKIGQRVYFSSKMGGGSYGVIGHINCERCKGVFEERETQKPNRKERKRGYYYVYSKWCPHCNFWEGKDKQIIIH